MSLDELIARHKMNVRGVLHVGAHLAEEAADYDRCGVGPVWWVEANSAVCPRIASALQYYPQQQLIQGLVYSEDGVVLDFNVTNYDGMSSSIFKFGTHPQFSPDTVFVDQLRLPTVTIDTLVEAWCVEANMLVMDIQGAELYALLGATRFMNGVDYVLSELNREEVYVGCAHVEQIEAHLADFQLADAHWVEGQGWGDGLFVRRSLL